MDRPREAQQDYRKAFQEFAAKVQHVQTLTAQAHVDPEVMQAALVELERAHVNYDACRDRWAQFLLSDEQEFILEASDTEHAHEDSVRTIAELLWQSAGRPEGTADEDWRKAEDIVKQAAAAVGV